MFPFHLLCKEENKSFVVFSGNGVHCFLKEHLKLHERNVREAPSVQDMFEN